MQLELEVKVSLDMIEYFINQRTYFDESNNPFYIASMKLIGALMTEVINILLICT